MVYGLIVLMLIGPFHLFNFFYLCAGLCLLLFSLNYIKIKDALYPFLWRILLMGTGLAVLCFLCVEARIISFASGPYEKDADYLLVLGSKVNEDGPSSDYRARLESAYEYLLENERTLVICCGGKGSDEPVSEGQAGKDFLVSRGIDVSRIAIEDQSTNTLQNIANASRIIDKKKKRSEVKLLIVSADYHLYRAAFLAGKCGFKEVSCKGGHGLWILLPQYYSREFFALIKEYLFLGF